MSLKPLSVSLSLSVSLNTQMDIMATQETVKQTFSASFFHITKLLATELLVMYLILHNPNNISRSLIFTLFSSLE